MVSGCVTLSEEFLGGTIALVIPVALNIIWQMQTSPIKEEIIVELTASQGDHTISAVRKSNSLLCETVTTAEVI